MYTPLRYNDTFSAATAKGRRGEFLTRDRPGEGQACRSRRLTTTCGASAAELQAAFRETNDTLTFNALSLDRGDLGDVRRPLLVLLGAVGFVLLVACANVANLLLARASARQAELAVRSALGAGRVRLLRQLLTEAVVLGAAGAVAGPGDGVPRDAGARRRAAGRHSAPGGGRRERRRGLVHVCDRARDEPGLRDAAVAAVQRHAPAERTAREHTGRRGGGGHHLRAALVVAEMALAVVLLVGAGLLIRSFVHLTRVDPGFRAEQALSFRVTLQGETVPAR